MITGTVSRDGVPVITLQVEGQDWTAIIDTGFNGDLELPDALRGKLNDQPAGRLRSALAAGRIVEEDAYSVEFSFDGHTCHAIATFVPDPQILAEIDGHRIGLGLEEAGRPFGDLSYWLNWSANFRVRAEQRGGPERAVAKVFDSG